MLAMEVKQVFLENSSPYLWIAIWLAFCIPYFKPDVLAARIRADLVLFSSACEIL